MVIIGVNKMKQSTGISNDFCPQTLFLYGTYKEDHTPNFGLFCWFSYYMDDNMGVMACIGGKKLTKDLIFKNKVFSANLVTEELLPLADYFGTTNGNDSNKMKIQVDVQKGEKLDIPILVKSPLTYELELDRTINFGDNDILLCKIRNVLADEQLCDKGKSFEDRIKAIKPVHTTCQTYFGWNGEKIGKWGEVKNIK
jgi:flavin reductase (DIM6/NTAB) family NADH-FMN oxidoreductase RutF